MVLSLAAWAGALALPIVMHHVIARNVPAMQATEKCYDAAKAYYKGDSKRVLQYLQPFADRGQADAERRVADIYAYGGGGIQPDAIKAVKLYRKAALKGDAKAAAGLAAIFDDEPGSPQAIGVPKNAVKSSIWLRLAADEGDADSQMSLGDAYSRGEGVAKNPAQAAIWYRKSAHQGLVPAQIRLAQLYEEGTGVPEDTNQAAYWYRKAADKGEADGESGLAGLYYNGDGVPEDHVRAFILNQKAANQGDALSQYFVGMAYLKGDGVPRDIVRAEMWLILSSDSYYPKNDDYYFQIAWFRDNTAIRMTLDDLARARGLAADFKPEYTGYLPEGDNWCGLRSGNSKKSS